LDDNILSSIFHEYGEVNNAKIFWNILEIMYSEKTNEDEGENFVADLQLGA